METIWYGIDSGRLIEFIPAMKALIAELNDLLATPEGAALAKDQQREWILNKLSAANKAVYESLPLGVAAQLTMERDPHGNVQVSLIETEKLLSEMVANKLAAWKKEGKFNGKVLSFDIISSAMKPLCSSFQLRCGLLLCFGYKCRHVDG